MNFVSTNALEGALRAAGGVPAPKTARSSTDVRAKLSQTAFAVLRRTLDLARMISSRKTIQPEQIYNLERIATLLTTPVDKQVSHTAGHAGTKHSQSGMSVSVVRGGDGSHGNTVMPGSYFSGGPDANFHVERPNHAIETSPHDNSIIRPGLVASGVFFGPRVYEDNAYVGDGGVWAAAGGGGSSPRSSERPRVRKSSWLEDDALAAMISEYRSRSAGSSDVRINEEARSLVKKIVEAHVVAVLAAAANRASKSRKSKFVAVTPSDVAAVTKGWRLF
jgi:histone H3/H4